MQISERIHDGYFNLESQYYKHPFKYAVDGDENTAWKSARCKEREKERIVSYCQL